MQFDVWVKEIASLVRPSSVHICTGSEEEYQAIAKKMCDQKTLIPLNPLKRPHSFWCHSHPDDVARVEESTFICSATERDAGPTNHWKDPVWMEQHLRELFQGCMQGRVMYVIPYCMGPIDSPFSKIGVEITDSPYVVLNMKLMTRMGEDVLQRAKKESFVPGIHSVGVPLKPGEKDVPWPCNPKKRCIVHFPDKKEIWSFGSGYGGNALLGKKCFALRIASVLGRDEGWLAEHMLILGITNPEGEKKYFAAAFPSACGKTNLAMMTPTLPGWKIECVGDDIAWLHFQPDGRLYAINPEAGYFGVAPGTSFKTNPNAMQTITKNTIFTNVALTQDQDVWWEGSGVTPSGPLTSWLGSIWDSRSGQPAAHPNARFTVTAQQNPIYDPMAEQPLGVPISAILFGGRRRSVMPLVYESFDWNHGVFMGASLCSETTAAAKGEVGKLRHDPFAMLPFCGYHMGDYFSHWIRMGRLHDSSLLPKIYHVNWFRKGDQNQFLWPGYGENIRVLKWIFERTSHQASGDTTPIGVIPRQLEIQGLHGIDLEPLFRLNQDEWQQEYARIEDYFQLFGTKLPPELSLELRKLKARWNPSH